MNTSNHIPPDNSTLQEFSDASRTIRRGDRLYYEISPYHAYWVDPENREFKESLALWVGYRVSGNFNPLLFLESLAYLTDRHECLRSNFLALDGKYYITSEENSSFSKRAFADSLMLDLVDGKDIISWIYFKDHAFDIENSPLFQARIARNEEGGFLVSIRGHHAILDKWSWEILLRDLLTAYRYFEMGRLPELPPLLFQYKDWLGWKRHLVEKNYPLQKEHWYSLYKGLPGRLLIPGGRINDNPGYCREGKKEFYHLSGGALERVQNLCLKYRVNLFMIFRATFMLYLSKITGQEDILIGTMVTGRTTINSQLDQIGFYAYTDLNRVIFDSGDSLKEAVEKVKRSFKDMYLYNDYTLYMALSDIKTPGSISAAPFWNVNLDFEESFSDAGSTPISEGGTFTDIRLDRLPSEDIGMVTDMDLKLKIVDKKDQLEIRVLYDCELYDSKIINDLITGYLEYIDKQ